MHRETTISREIKLLKNKFELLEKNRQFKSILQKSGNNFNSIAGDTNTNDDLNLGLESNKFQTNNSATTATRTRSETNASDSLQLVEDGDDHYSRNGSNKFQKQLRNRSVKNVRIKLSKLNQIGRFVTRLFKLADGNKLRKKSNRVSSLHSSEENQLTAIATTTINPQSYDLNGNNSNNNGNRPQLDDDQPIESSANAKASNKIRNLKRVGLFGRFLK